MAEVFAVALGLMVGLSLGALGGGGSTLAVPILVFVAGMQAQAATTASLLVVGVASAIGVVGHFRNGNVRLGAGVAFGATGIVGARLGTLLNRSLDERMLLLAFSVLIAFVAVRMYRSIGAQPPELADSGPLAAEMVDTVAATARSNGSTLTSVPAITKPPITTRPSTTRPGTTRPGGLDLSAPALAKLAGAATGVGLLTGLFGVGGGFAVVPALTLLLGFKAKEAIGTSLVVIAINAMVALAMRQGELDFDWGLVLPFLATVTAGVLIGSVIARRIHAHRLTRSFAIMLGAVAAYTAISTILH